APQLFLDRAATPRRGGENSPLHHLGNRPEDSEYIFHSARRPKNSRAIVGTGQHGMAFVSVTRLRVRSIWFVLPFVLASRRSRQQLRRSPGFIEGRLTIEFPMAFWTMSIWRSHDDMRGFRNAPPHLDAMRRLPRWCDEASYVHWEQRDTELPSIDVA